MKEKDPCVQGLVQTGQICGQSWFQGRGEGAGWLHLVLIALPAGGCSGDKLDTGATAPKAPVATGTEAGAPQAVPTTGGEGVAAAPTKTQASTSNAAATAMATGNGGGNHSCRKRGDVVRIKGRREDTWGVRVCALKSVGCRMVSSGSCLPASSLPACVVRLLSYASAWLALCCSTRHLYCLDVFLPPLCSSGPLFPFQDLMATSLRSYSSPPSFPFDPITFSPLPCPYLPLWSGFHVSLPSGSS